MDYFKRPEISNSDLRHLAKSYADFMEYKKNGQEVTAAMQFGTIVHEFVLEDKRNWALNSKILEEIGGKKPTATKAYKEWVEKQDSLILSQENYELLINMRRNISKTKSKFILERNENVEIEKEFYFEMFGVKCRSKLDFVDYKNKVVCDLKTIAEITPDSIYKAVRWNYLTQAAFYTQAVESQVFEDDWKFKFVFAEKKAPYKVVVVEVPRHLIRIGMEEIKKVLEKMKCDRSLKNGYQEEMEVS